MVKVFAYSKHHESPDRFEQRVSEFLNSIGDVLDLKASESLFNSDIVLTITYGEKKSVEQEICIIAWDNLANIESAVNSTLERAEKLGKCGKFINFVTTSKSPRVLAVFVVESSGRGNTNDAERTEDQQEAKQNQDINVKAKRRRKPKSVD